MNKAINREELLRVLYKGRATPMYVAGFYPDLGDTLRGDVRL